MPVSLSYRFLTSVLLLPDHLAPRADRKRLALGAYLEKFSFASLMVRVPDPTAEVIRQAKDLFWHADLAEFGVEEDPHITVKYGFDDPSGLDKVRVILAGQTPFKVKVGSASMFVNDEFDVVQLGVTAPEINRLNRELSRKVSNQDTHPMYFPHLTLAYVLPGKGKEYVGHVGGMFEGQTFEVTELVYSDPDGKETVIPLQAPTTEEVKSMPTPEPGEDKKTFVSRCIPIVLKDGTAEDDNQAVAVCGSIWDKRQEAQAGVEGTPLRITHEAVVHPSGDDATGTEWLVTLIGPPSSDSLVKVDGEEFVLSKNGRVYSVAALEASVAAWDGVKVYDNHLTDEEFLSRGGMRSPKNEWLGTIVGTYWDKASRKIMGTFKVVEKALADKLKMAWKADVLKTIGLSIDAFTDSTRRVQVNGEMLPVVDGFRSILSVDLVGDPAAGGAFERLLAAAPKKRKETIVADEVDIKKLVKDELAAALTGLPGMVADAVKAASAAPATETEEVVDETEEVEDTTEDVVGDPPNDDNLSAVQEARKEVELARSELVLERELGKANLGDVFEQPVREAFAGRVFKKAELVRMIEQMRKAKASMDVTGRVRESGNSRGDISVGMDPRDKAEVEFMRLVMGNTAFRGLESVTDELVTDRLTESFKAWAKEGKPSYGTMRLSSWAYDLLGGNPLNDPRAYEAITTSGMSSIIKNTLNLMLAHDYSQRERWWDPIVRVEEVDTIDQATLVRVYGMDTLDVVDEGQPYTEVDWGDDEETATFVKKGNYAGVTLETLLSDKLSVVRSIPLRLSNAWFNTLSDLNAAVFTVNSAAGPILSDTGALFNATAATTAGGHANLLTTAFGTTVTAYGAARLAMMKQTDQALGVGRRLGIIPAFLLTPFDLEIAAKVVMNTVEGNPGQANYEINPYAKESQVIPVPQWTDATDWALVANPQIHPAIWNIFLRGQRAPQLFTSDQETAGALFTNDVFRYKVRMMTWRFSSTYDCAPVSDFRPLHKSNVS